MKPTVLVCGALIVLAGALRTPACGPGPDVLSELARQAVSADPAVSRAAIARLRAEGPGGLGALVELYDRLNEGAIQDAEAVEEGLADEPDLRARLHTALDAVGGQKDCAAARLFWHTDLESAKSQAHIEGKPILSLRLLGKLTDEFSCANSRFFRTTLYANQEVSRALRERFVLHWQSVRPVPRVTIDFGDGRRIERTLTGNSVHYVLDSRARVVDALPGLYGPAAFLRLLEQAEEIARRTAAIEATHRASVLAAYHAASVEAIAAAWTADLEQLGTVAEQPPGGKPDAGEPADAVEAALVAETKAAVELPLLESVVMRPPLDLERATGEEQWQQIAALHEADARLDPSSRSLMRTHHFTAAAASRLAMTKRVIEDPLIRVVAEFERSLAIDTVRNEYLLHRRIHEWFAARQPVSDLDSLNERVYAELFLTPSSDPWLGLVDPNTYTALSSNGVIE